MAVLATCCVLACCWRGCKGCTCSASQALYNSNQDSFDHFVVRAAAGIDWPQHLAWLGLAGSSGRCQRQCTEQRTIAARSLRTDALRAAQMTPNLMQVHWYAGHGLMPGASEFKPKAAEQHKTCVVTRGAGTSCTCVCTLTLQMLCHISALHTAAAAALRAPCPPPFLSRSP
jgi:hypothetical protein